MWKSHVKTPKSASKRGNNSRRDFLSLREANTPKESEIKTSIRRYLNLIGIWHYNQWQGQFSVQGISDLVGMMPDGRYLAIEIKRPGEKPTDKQQAFLDEVNARKGVAFLATSVDDVIRELQIKGLAQKIRV